MRQFLGNEHTGELIDESSIGATLQQNLADPDLEHGALQLAPAANRIAWLIDNVEAYASLLASLRGARRSVHIAQLAFDADFAACAGDSRSAPAARDAVLAEALIDLAASGGLEIRILLNATWILDTARPLRTFFRRRGVPRERIEVRGMSRFPNFMHAKVVIVDGEEAFLLGSPFVNSYWDDGSHLPFDPRRPSVELGGRPLHDVSVQLRGPAVGALEKLFAGLWETSGEPATRPARSLPAPSAPREAGMRIVCDAPDGMLAGSPNGATHVLRELLAGIARAQSFIYIEHQYLTSRPIVAALAEALRLVPALEIIIVLNQNPDLTAYRGWQSAQLGEHALLRHPRVGVFTLWSACAHPGRAGVTRINQLFIHSKVIVVDDEWAVVGTSNLDGVSTVNYGADFAGTVAQQIFRGVRNVEVNIVIDATEPADDSNAPDAFVACEASLDSIVTLRERLWSEHLGCARDELGVRATAGRLAMWREAARTNASRLSERAEADAPMRVPRMIGRVLPYSDRPYPRQQLEDAGVDIGGGKLELCYDPTWFGAHLALHWVRNIF